MAKPLTIDFGVFTYRYSTNLGDEIQTLSAAQYLPRIDTLIERDRLHWYRSSSPVFVIFNGWFTHQPFWPPPPSIYPLFVSFHAQMPELLVNRRLASYFKQYEPIGCRSLSTVEAFRAIGVSAYFSGCLTLTLKRIQVPRTDRMYAVDVDPNLFRRVVPRGMQDKLVQISHEFPSPGAGMWTEPKCRSAQFAIRAIYKWGVLRSILDPMGERLNRLRHITRLAKARELLALYSSAKLVITSRLHCALPCLALGTPVLLLRADVESDQRFAGLRELIPCHSDWSRLIKMDWNNPEPNPTTYVRYATELRERCEDAVRRIGASELAGDAVRRQAIDNGHS